MYLFILVEVKYVISFSDSYNSGKSYYGTLEPDPIRTGLVVSFFKRLGKKMGLKMLKIRSADAEIP